MGSESWVTLHHVECGQPVQECPGRLVGWGLLAGALQSKGLILTQQLLPDWLLFLHQCLLAVSWHLSILGLVTCEFQRTTLPGGFPRHPGASLS